MEFALSESERLVQESVQRLLSNVATLDRVQSHTREETAWAQDIWLGMSELGIPGLLVPEDYEGLGLSQLHAALVAEMLGRHVTPVPFVASLVMAPLAIIGCASPAQRRDWLPALASGALKVGVALSTQAAGKREEAQLACVDGRLNGRALFVLDSSSADVFVVADRATALYWVDGRALGLTRQGLRTVDATRSVGELIFADVAAEPLPEGDSERILQRMINAGRVMLAADTLGAAQRMLELAVAYAADRVQFGRPIGSFQAIKHLCAEMAAELEPARSLVWYAGYALDECSDESDLMAAHAKAHLAEVGAFVARSATEVHGGIGFTELLGLHLWFKRINANRQLLGSPSRLRNVAAQIQGLH